MATSMVAGNMIGSGIFLLPSALAEFGGISLIGWLCTSAGAIILALSFSFAARWIPKTGGMYTYTRVTMGNAPAFFVGWGYWMAITIGCAAVATALIGYLSVFFPILKSNSLLAASIALVAIWGIVFLNVSGVKNSGRFQLTTTLLKISALFLVILAAAGNIDFSNFHPFNASDQSPGSAIKATAILTFWAFLGLESATVIAENVENPEKNVPRATFIGTSLVAVIYILSTSSVMMILPKEGLITSTAPFADAANSVFGSWAYYAVAIGAIISCAGTLNGMTLNAGQMPFSLSRDLLFPSFLKKISRRGTVENSLLLSGLVVTVLLIMNYSDGLVNLFKNLIQLSTFSILLPFAMTAIACLILLNGKARGIKKSAYLFWSFIAVLALIYAVWAFTGPGWSIIWKGLLLLLASLPIYLWFGVYKKPSEENDI